MLGPALARSPSVHTQRHTHARTPGVAAPDDAAGAEAAGEPVGLMRCLLSNAPRAAAAFSSSSRRPATTDVSCATRGRAQRARGKAAAGIEATRGRPSAHTAQQQASRAGAGEAHVGERGADLGKHPLHCLGHQRAADELVAVALGRELFQCVLDHAAGRCRASQGQTGMQAAGVAEAACALSRAWAARRPQRQAFLHVLPLRLLQFRHPLDQHLLLLAHHPPLCSNLGGRSGGGRHCSLCGLWPCPGARRRRRSKDVPLGRAAAQRRPKKKKKKLPRRRAGGSPRTAGRARPHLLP